MPRQSENIPHFRLINVDNPIFGSCSSSHNVGEMRSHLQNIKDEAVKVKRNQDFLDRCNTISSQLDFIVSAVDAIAEVFPFPSKCQV